MKSITIKPRGDTSLQQEQQLCEQLCHNLNTDTSLLYLAGQTSSVIVSGNHPAFCANYKLMYEHKLQ